MASKVCLTRKPMFSLIYHSLPEEREADLAKCGRQKKKVHIFSVLLLASSDFHSTQFYTSYLEKVEAWHENFFDFESWLQIFCEERSMCKNKICISISYFLRGLSLFLTQRDIAKEAGIIHVGNNTPSKKQNNFIISSRAKLPSRKTQKWSKCKLDLERRKDDGSKSSCQK